MVQSGPRRRLPLVSLLAPNTASSWNFENSSENLKIPSSTFWVRERLCTDTDQHWPLQFPRKHHVIVTVRLLISSRMVYLKYAPCTYWPFLCRIEQREEKHLHFMNIICILPRPCPRPERSLLEKRGHHLFQEHFQPSVQYAIGF